MTTQPLAKRRKEFAAKLLRIDTLDQEGNLYKHPVLVFPPLDGHGKFPLRVGVKEETVGTVTPGGMYQVALEIGNAKKEQPKFDTDWYWNLLSISPAIPAAPPATMPAAAPQQGQSATPGPALVEEEAPWPEAPPRESGRPSPFRGDSRDTSIQRQVALKAAVELAVARGQTDSIGQPILAAGILAVADMFAAWIAGDIDKLEAQKKSG